MNIAFLGLGTMGAPMAMNLMKAGHRLTVWNRTTARTAPFREPGARIAATPAEAAQDNEVVMLCVSDTADVEAVLLRSPEGAVEGLARGSLVIDCSTISPEATREMASRLRDRNVGFVDAPVSGGSEGAVHGTLAVMCGGSDEDFARARPVLEAVGRSITHVGPVGAGQVAKAVNQVVIAGTYQSVAEGMVLAARAGVDPRRVRDAIRGGAAASWVLENRAENMLCDEYPLGFRVKLHRKDLGIALDSARRAGVGMPVASYVATMEDGLVAQGHGDEDMSALARIVRRNAGMADGPVTS